MDSFIAEVRVSGFATSPCGYTKLTINQKKLVVDRGLHTYECFSLVVQPPDQSAVTFILQSWSLVVALHWATIQPKNTWTRKP